MHQAANPSSWTGTTILDIDTHANENDDDAFGGDTYAAGDGDEDSF